jgi:hypothetical protein
MVDPLGEVLMKLLPEGFDVLFAPAAALPASVLTPPTPAVIPLRDDPVFLEPDAGTPAFVAGREVPVCASAHSLDTARAVANRIVPSFMRHLLLLGPKKWWTRRRSQRNVVSQAREMIGSSCELSPNLSRWSLAQTARAGLIREGKSIWFMRTGPLLPL